MGQESLNFNFEEPKQKYVPQTISIRKTLEEIDKKKLDKNESKENYNFLEDVPNWKEQLKKYELVKLIQEKVKNKKMFFNYGEDAAREVRDINDEYGKGNATYVDSKDVFGHKGFSLRIELPSKDDFSDILGKDGNILPSRNEHKLAS